MSVTDEQQPLPGQARSWASFPCQDLSLAGLTASVNGERSGLAWEWLRIMDGTSEKPPILVAENVVGHVSVDGGSQCRKLPEALRSRGYTVDAVRCLRTLKGGSSRQVLVLKRGDQPTTHLLTAREAARLMGAPDSFKLPGTYNDGSKAMGNAVAVRVTRYLGKHLSSPLWDVIR